MERPLHYRRCHICGETTTRTDGPIERCQGCHRSLAPFFYFDDRYVPIMSDTTLSAPQLTGEYRPVKGLSVYWEAF